MAGTSNGKVIAWNLLSERRTILEQSPGAVTALAFSPAGGIFVTPAGENVPDRPQAQEGFRLAKTLLRVGFFRELHDDPGLSSIREAVRSSRHPDQDRIVAYLEAGVCLAACGGVQHDVLDPSSKRVTSPDMVTDGVWLWPGELPYYVRVHGVELPAEFVSHMEQNGWAVPAFSDLEVRELCDRLGWKWQS